MLLHVVITPRPVCLNGDLSAFRHRLRQVVKYAAVLVCLHVNHLDLGAAAAVSYGMNRPHQPQHARYAAGSFCENVWHALLVLPS